MVLVLEKGIRVASLRPGPVGEIRGGDGSGSLNEWSVADRCDSC